MLNMIVLRVHIVVLRDLSGVARPWSHRIAIAALSQGFSYIEQLVNAGNLLSTLVVASCV